MVGNRVVIFLPAIHSLSVFLAMVIISEILDIIGHDCD